MTILFYDAALSHPLQFEGAGALVIVSHEEGAVIAVTVEHT
jgi:hypothetical protein